jgi:hypothetical protein
MGSFDLRLDLGSRSLAVVKSIVMKGIGLTLSLVVNGKDTFILHTFFVISEPVSCYLSTK